MSPHDECTCCRHWRAVEQPCAYSAEVPMPYERVQTCTPKEIADAARDGRRYRLMPPRLPA